MSKIDVARQAIEDNPGMNDRAVAKLAGISHMTVRRARAMKTAPPGWTVAGVNVAALGQLQEHAELPLGRALEIVLRAAESGELARDDAARVVAARWDLSGDTWLHYMPDGSLMREDPAPSTSKSGPRRSVQQRAE